MSAVFLYHTPPYSSETTHLTKPGARLMVNKSRHLPVSSAHSAMIRILHAAVLALFH